MPAKGQNIAADKLDEAGEDAVFALIARAIPMGTVADTFGVSQDTLERWIKRGGEERRERLADARTRAAEVVFEEAGEIADGLIAPESSAHVSAAKLRMEHRYKRAAFLDPERFGERTGVTINNNLSLGALHLDALRQANALPLPPKQLEGEVIDAEIVDPDTEEAA